VLYETSIKLPNQEVFINLGHHTPRMGNDGMGSGNARRRNARNKLHSFQYPVQLAAGMTHVRTHEGSLFLFGGFENRAAGIDIETATKVERLNVKVLEGFTVSARVAITTTKDIP